MREVGKALGLILSLLITAGTAPAQSRHWAFQPVKKTEATNDPTGWAENPIDRFIAAGWRNHDLTPSRPADRRTLLRRVSFDLIGLPPTPEELNAFESDGAPDAFSKVIERLLASPRYGERWGRYWMDLVRYADTAGDNADYPIPEARLYRDYIIDSFNADKPYDQFVREQLAGDVLAQSGPRERYAEQVIATTYLALSRRYLTAPYERWHLTLEDSIDTTGRAFLGLTLRCARCHDHKYDPITKSDYYALYGIFASTQYPFAGSEELVTMKAPRQHFVPLAPANEMKAPLDQFHSRVKQLTSDIATTEKQDPLVLRIQKLDSRIGEANKAIGARETPWHRQWLLMALIASMNREKADANSALSKKLAAMRSELRSLERWNTSPTMPVAYSVSEGALTDAHIQIAGEPEQLGPVVHRGVPKFLDGGKPIKIAPNSSGRLELAQWLTQPQNPLTARVMANRIWQHHFGRGIVATPSNFGLRGMAPTHPELLDWLAAEFVESGWSIKAMHRLIVSSKTYQLSSLVDSPSHCESIDPDNRWYWRHDRLRLDAEAIRDSLLMAGGNLDLARPGPHPFPPIGTWGWTQHNPFNDVYPSRHRSVYLMTQRFQRHPFLGIFDGPDTNTTTDRRPSSTVPSQALFMMNNPFVAEQANGLAKRLIASEPDSLCRLRLAYELAWGRMPTREEEQESLDYLDRYRRELLRVGVGLADCDREGWTSLAKVLLSANEFVYVD